jgi:uncharacterized protein with PIN domain
MLSLSKYKDNLLQLFRIQIEMETALDVSYKGKIYRITVEDLKQKHTRVIGKKTLVSKIEASLCPDCNQLLINTVCMNVNCPSNQ